MTEPKNWLNLGFRIVYNVDDISKVPMNPVDFTDKVKFNIAEMINEMNDMRDGCEDADQKRLCSIAITKLEEACMFMVKAAKWEE